MIPGRWLVDKVAMWSGALRWGAARASRGLTILMYHRVLPRAEAGGYPLKNLVITRETFEQQVRWIAKAARVVTVREGLDMLRSGRLGTGKPVVAFTFDDGYLDNAEHAAPILEAHGVRGTFFVTTGFIEGKPFWFDCASRFCVDHLAGRAPKAASEVTLKEASPHMGSLDAWLGWLKSMPAARRNEVLSDLGATCPPDNCAAMGVDRLVVLARAGHEIGAHTMTHPVLTGESIEVVMRELVGSKRRIEEWIGQPVAGFCYPNGSWNDDVRQGVIDAGFSYATTTRRQLNMATDDDFTLGRRWIAPDKTTNGGKHCAAGYAAEVLGLHDFIRDKMGRPRGPHGTPPRRTHRPVRTAA